MESSSPLSRYIAIYLSISFSHLLSTRGICVTLLRYFYARSGSCACARCRRRTGLYYDPLHRRSRGRPAPSPRVPVSRVPHLPSPILTVSVGSPFWNREVRKCTRTIPGSGSTQATSSTMSASDRDGEKRPVCCAPRLVVAKHR